MKHFFMVAGLCLTLTACETIDNISMPSIFSDDNDMEVTKVETKPKKKSQLSEDELNELEQLTGIYQPRPIREIIEVETPKAEPVMLSQSDKDQTPIFNMQDDTIKGCPSITIMPTTKSITYFEDNMSGKMKARASISDVQGGCEVVKDGIEVDLDIMMRGTIHPAGRFGGDINNEAFMTFPYFVLILDENNKRVHKDILATAMRFRPIVDHLEHAEKITQFIPIDNVASASNYKIIVGYQLTRKQLEYNRIQDQKRPDDKRVSPDTSKANKLSTNPL